MKVNMATIRQLGDDAVRLGKTAIGPNGVIGKPARKAEAFVYREAFTDSTTRTMLDNLRRRATSFNEAKVQPFIEDTAKPFWKGQAKPAIDSVIEKVDTRIKNVLKAAE